MKVSKYLWAVALIISVAGCQSSTKTGGAPSGASSTPSSVPSSAPSSARSSAEPSLPPPTPLKRVAELSHEGGFILGNELAVPTVAVYSDGTVVLNGEKRLTLTPGALDFLISTLQQDLKGQPTDKVLVPTGGHANPDGGNTVVAVYQPGGTYQSIAALGLGTSTASQYPAPVADAFAKLQALTSDATTPYTTTRVRYSLKCPTGGNGPEKPWPSALPQPGAGQPNTCEELRSADGGTAAAVRAACADMNTPATRPQPTVYVYRSAAGLRVCWWRYALPDEKP